MKLVVAMLQAIHVQGDHQAVIAKSKDVVVRLREMKLMKAAKKMEDSIVKTFEYMFFPQGYWKKIRSNNIIERSDRETKQRIDVVGTFPDGESALMLVCA